MNNEKMRCPNCAGRLEVADNGKKKTCPFCDSVYIVSDIVQKNINGKPSEEKLNKDKIYDVMCTYSGKDKVKIIKKYREETKIGLREAKDAIDAIPGVLFENVSQMEGERLIKAFNESGCICELIEK